MDDRLTPSERLIVALDTPNLHAATRIVERLEGRVIFYKIGLELVMNGGLDLARELASANYSVFLDMKLLDIENTVQHAIANIANAGVRFLTVHGMDSKTLRAAMQGAQGSDLSILAVTVLTNLTDADLVEQGVGARSASDLVIHRAKLAQQAGCHGVVSSGEEAAAVRAATGSDFFIVTPGIRLGDDRHGDQVRVTTPQAALSGGASHIVVGRPITQADDVRAAAEDFLQIVNRQ